MNFRAVCATALQRMWYQKSNLLSRVIVHPHLVQALFGYKISRGMFGKVVFFGKPRNHFIFHPSIEKLRLAMFRYVMEKVLSAPYICKIFSLARWIPHSTSELRVFSSPSKMGLPPLHKLALNGVEYPTAVFCRVLDI